jgi:YHS domain-containing protein
MTRRIHRQNGVLKAELADASSCIMPSHVNLRRFATVLALAGCLGSARAQGVALNSDIISDPTTGAALLGFDPVSYFIDQRARKGLASLQAMFGGKVWFFTSPANKSAFLANPMPYLPAFGGHDPVGVAAGIAVSGSPEFFLVRGERIYLFRHAQSREAFQKDQSILPLAESNWPQVKQELVP